jgi:hypothetical protein
VVHLRTRTGDIDISIESVCTNNPHVEYVISGLGNWDYKLLIAAKSLPRLLVVEEELLQAIGKPVLQHFLCIRDKVFSVRTRL